MKEIDFVKAVAAGNDFIILDFSANRKPLTANRLKELAQQLCRRKLSIGADGLLILEPAQKGDFKMRIFNPDGSEAEMCGNGARCIALYARQNKVVSGSKMVIETRAGNLAAEVKQKRIKIKMSHPQGLRLRFDLDINGRKLSANYLNTGVPHLVSFVQGLDNVRVHQLGKAIRYHREFQPAGTNADFVEIVDEGRIRLRTYERGVEEETLACGTGAVAAAIIAAYETRPQPQGRFKIQVDTRSGETLTVYFTIKNNDVDDVYLEGKAEIIYQGSINMP